MKRIKYLPVVAALASISVLTACDNTNHSDAYDAGRDYNNTPATTVIDTNMHTQTTPMPNDTGSMDTTGTMNRR